MWCVHKIGLVGGTLDAVELVTLVVEHAPHAVQHLSGVDQHFVGVRGLVCRLALGWGRGHHRSRGRVVDGAEFVLQLRDPACRQVGQCRRASPRLVSLL